MHRNARNFLLAFLIISSLLLAVLILSDWLPWLRGPAPETSEWYWPHLLRPLGRWWLPILSALFLWLSAAWWLVKEKSSRRQNLTALTFLVICSLLLQLALIFADRPTVTSELVDRTLSNLASGFFEPATEIDDINLVLRTYPQVMPDFVSEHARTHPPGLILANWLTINAFSRVPAISESTAQLIYPLRCADLWLLNRPPEVASALGVWSLLPLLAAALTVFPAFAVAKMLLNGRAVRLATVLAATLPALLLFAPKSVQLYAPLTLILFGTFLAGMNKRSPLRLLISGIILSLMTFLSFGNVSLALLLTLFAFFSTWLMQPNNENKTTKWIRLVKHLVVFALGSLSLWLLFWMAWGVTPLTVAQTGLQQHYELVTNDRRYEWWLVWNVIDLILFAGWPVALGFIGALILSVQPWRNKALKATDVLAYSLLILVLVLNISGSSRGEVGRIWLFFMPLIVYPAARFWQRTLPGKTAAITIIALQLLMTVVLGLAWRPVRAVIVVPEKPVMPAVTAQNELDGQFQDEQISLNGFSLQPDSLAPGDDMNLTLYWGAQGPAKQPYTVFNHLLNDDGDLVAQQDNWPVNGSWPPTCWRSGDLIVDAYTITLPDNLQPGPYHLYTGLYNANTNERLLSFEGLDSIKLQTIIVESD